MVWEGRIRAVMRLNNTDRLAGDIMFYLSEKRGYVFPDNFQRLTIRNGLFLEGNLRMFGEDIWSEPKRVEGKRKDEFYFTHSISSCNNLVGGSVNKLRGWERKRSPSNNKSYWLSGSFKDFPTSFLSILPNSANFCLSNFLRLPTKFRDTFSRSYKNPRTWLTAVRRVPLGRVWLVYLYQTKDHMVPHCSICIFVIVIHSLSLSLPHSLPQSFFCQFF